MFELVVKCLVWLVAVWWSWLLRGLLLWLCSVVVRSVSGRSTNKKTNSHLVACWSGAPPKAGTWGRRNYIFINTRVTVTTTENKNNGFACFRRNGVFRLLLVLSYLVVVIRIWGGRSARQAVRPSAVRPAGLRFCRLRGRQA